MPEPDKTITNCESCGNAMDVSAVAPFSNVECPTCGAKNRVKRDFGHYTLVRRLAEGGMSLVFVAVDNTLGREVALKILNEDYSADERRIAAFEEEARITASFSHPNVVRVFTTGRAFGRFYIAMELVPGGHFEHQIRERGKIPEIEILPFAMQVAEGLEAARAAGLIHRDVKPGNILLDAQGNVKIVDFGLALVTKGGSATAQEIWATPYYVPPETIDGQAEDFRSDLYAFGATLYHALAGKPSCDEKSMATDVLRQAKKHIRPLRSAAPDVSDETCALVDKAMAYDPKARFGSYEEMMSALRVALGRLKKAGPGGVSTKLKRRASAKRGEWLAIAGAGLVLVIAVGGGLAWILRKEPAKPEPEPIAIQAPDISDDPGNATLIGQRFREAREAVDSGAYEKARKTFAGLRDDNEVQEPTRSWAAIEAVVVTFLDGRTVDAKKEAKAAAEHIKTTDLADQRMGERLLNALAKVDDLEPVTRKNPESIGDDAAWALAMMLGGVKNWEQGLTKLAASDFFEPLVAANFKPKDHWVRGYQKIAKLYLADMQTLSDPVFDSVPNDRAACKAAIERLDGLLKDIKTHGRARFNVRAFQLDLARQMKLLDQAKPEVDTTDLKQSVSLAIPDPSPSVDPLVKFQELTKACKFDEASQFAKSLTSDPPGATRDSLAAVSASALNFLGFVEEDIGKSLQPVQLRSRNGGQLDSVKITKPGTLTAVSTNGTADHLWGEIDPESIIQFYRSNARNRTSELDQLQRHECAIAYDWLVGDRGRATAAADRLSLDSLIFKRRWEALASGLPKN